MPLNVQVELDEFEAQAFEAVFGDGESIYGLKGGRNLLIGLLRMMMIDDIMRWFFIPSMVVQFSFKSQRLTFLD